MLAQVFLWNPFRPSSVARPGPGRRSDVYLSKVPVPALPGCDTLSSEQPDLFTCGEILVASWAGGQGALSPRASSAWAAWCKLLPGVTPAVSSLWLSLTSWASPEVFVVIRAGPGVGSGSDFQPTLLTSPVSTLRHSSRHSQCVRPILICWLNITHTHWTSQIISVISARYFSYFQHIECPYTTEKYLLMNQNIHAVVSNMSIWRI